EEGREARPARLELGAGERPPPAGGVADAHAAAGDVVQDDPVVALPVHDRRESDAFEVARGDLYGAGREAELRRGGADRLEARAVGRRVAELSDAREADLPPVVPADHREARG